MRLQHFAIYIGLFFCTLFTAQAQQLSYVYIQGDKETPFYVKLENEMMPRYGKNFSILSELAPGPIHIQVLFQQNSYPPVNFTISVPETGFRGFMLTRKGTEFSLYDLYYHFYIAANNTITDDRAPNRSIRTSIPPSASTSEATPVVVPPPAPKVVVVKPKAKPPVITPPPVVVVKQDTTTPAPKDNGQPQFMDDVVLDNGRTMQNGILNSDCPVAMSSEDLKHLQDRLFERQDSDRLALLLNRLSYCFSTKQVGALAGMLSSDEARYKFIEKAYPRTSDQSDYPSLESSFATQEWKDKFKALVAH